MLKVFEFQFNPENSATFCYFPSNRQERKSGLLFLIGQADNKEVLEQVSNEIKEGFYRKSENGEDVFQVGLDFANQFLKEQRTGLSFGALCLQNPYTVKLSKTGNIKMLLLRGNQAFDMSFELTENYNSFPNFIEGALKKKDKVLLLTKDVFNVFLKEKMLEEISELKAKEVKKYFKERKELLKNLSGSLILGFVKRVRKPWFTKKRKASPKFGATYARIPAGRIEKIVVSVLGLIILLLLGYLLF